MGSNMESYLTSHPDENGFFGKFGGSFLPPNLQHEMDEIKNQYLKIRDTPEFMNELNAIRKNYQGRPTALQYAKRLSESIGGGRDVGVEIYLKREDLNHTGAHKLNHCVSLTSLHVASFCAFELPIEILTFWCARWLKYSSQNTSESAKLLRKPVQVSMVLR
jgi:hypothetical protein